MPVEATHETEVPLTPLSLENPMDQAYLSTASETAASSAPLQLADESTNPLVALVADIRGATMAATEGGDLARNANANYSKNSTAKTSTVASRTEPALWAIGAIALCGLGLAGLGAPLLAARLAPVRKGGKA